MKLYVSHKEALTEVLGPGRRFALWTQGCKRRCPGCIFPEGQPTDKNGIWLETDDLAAEIIATPNIVGLTVSGGEPFLQAEALAHLIKKLKENTLLDFMMFSGYTLEELRQREDLATDYILGSIDILVDGEYVEEKNDGCLWRGSSNQNIHFLSPKYRPYREKIENAKNRNVEFVYRGEYDLFMVGIPAKNFQRDLWKETLKQTRKEQREE